MFSYLLAINRLIDLDSLNHEHAQNISLPILNLLLEFLTLDYLKLKMSVRKNNFISKPV